MAELKPKELIYRVESDAKGMGIVRTYVGELVRCKDCQWFDANSDYYDSYCDKNGISVEEDFFCADGERR